MDLASPTKSKKRMHSESAKSHKKQKKSESSATHKIKDKKDKKRHSHKTEEKAESLPEKISFPFFTQTISLWVPLYPVGFDRPISSVADQHLAGLLDHYSPLLGGYLLAYHNVNLSDSSVRANPNRPPDDGTPAILASVDEYAVGYGWMTVDVDLFVPSRGAWLEGKVILQNEGSIGVNCWEKFNAGIEASRLPSGWKYVEVDTGISSDIDAIDATEVSGETGATGEDCADNESEDPEGNVENKEQTQDGKDKQQPLEQMHPTGYWVDELGIPVRGNLLFRIKDFDVGLAGDNGYLAIEGTMLEPDNEFRLMLNQRKKSRAGKAGGKTRRLPEFSITQFGKYEGEDEDKNPTEAFKGSKVSTSDS